MAIYRARKRRTATQWSALYCRYAMTCLAVMFALAIATDLICDHWLHLPRK